MIEGKTEQETVTLTALALGISEETAHQVIAFERSLIDEDEVIVAEEEEENDEQPRTARAKRQAH